MRAVMGEAKGRWVIDLSSMRLKFFEHPPQRMRRSRRPAQRDPEAVKQAVQFGSAIGAAQFFRRNTSVSKGLVAWSINRPSGVYQVQARRSQMISAFSLRGDFRFMVRDGRGTSLIFKEFFVRLMIFTPRLVFVIANQNLVHKSGLVQAYIDRLNGKLKLFYLLFHCLAESECAVRYLRQDAPVQGAAV